MKCISSCLDLNVWVKFFIRFILMAERFDILVQGMSESDASALLLENTLNVQRPADRYFAATRLGLSNTEESLNLLLHAVDKLSIDELYDRITRRKSIEALGRRKDLRAIPTLVGALNAVLILRLSLMQLFPWSELVGSHSLMI